MQPVPQSLHFLQCTALSLLHIHQIVSCCMFCIINVRIIRYLVMGNGLLGFYPILKLTYVLYIYFCLSNNMIKPFGLIDLHCIRAFIKTPIKAQKQPLCLLCIFESINIFSALGLHHRCLHLHQRFSISASHHRRSPIWPPSKIFLRIEAQSTQLAIASASKL